MRLKNSHKALAITILICGTLLVLVYNINAVEYKKPVTESFIEIATIKKIKREIEKKEEVVKPKDNSKKTNRAFNSTKKHKRFAAAFKPIDPPEDFDDPRLKNRGKVVVKTEKEPSKKKQKSTITKKELTAFKSVNSILKKRQNAAKKSKATASSNKNSSITYSLIDRIDLYLPVPVYLCEAGGTIIVNITVNKSGRVVSSSLNSASTSKNKCLQDHALNYAKKARFDTSEKASQLGTISFSFKSKN